LPPKQAPAAGTAGAAAPLSRLDELTARAQRVIAGGRGAGGPPGPLAPPAATGAPPPAASEPAAPVVVLGIDPGTATTGYGVVRGFPEGEGRYEVLTYGVVETAADVPMPRRLLTLYRELRRLIGEYQPTAAAVERLFFGRNTTTAISVGQARGVILLALAEAGLSVEEYTPAEIKRALSGSGRAQKVQMQRMTQAILDLPERPQPDDAADALAIVVCYLRLSRRRALGLR
jgi:crossover junction endodeoxyribonuclease RuvC